MRPHKVTKALVRGASVTFSGTIKAYEFEEWLKLDERAAIAEQGQYFAKLVQELTLPKDHDPPEIDIKNPDAYKMLDLDVWVALSNAAGEYLSAQLSEKN